MKGLRWLLLRRIPVPAAPCVPPPWHGDIEMTTGSDGRCPHTALMYDGTSEQAGREEKKPKNQVEMVFNDKY